MKKTPRSSFPGKGTRSLAPPAAPAHIEEKPTPPRLLRAALTWVGFGRSWRSRSARTSGRALVACAAAWPGLREWRGLRRQRVATPAQGGVSDGKDSRS